MYISRIRLQNWKNFKDTEADLARRVFIIGPNASGKSNLLDAFRFLRDLATKGLRQAVSARGGVSAIRCLAARESPSIALDVTISSDDGDLLWRYEIEFNQDAQRTPLVRTERVEDLRDRAVLLDRPDAADKGDPVRQTQTALEQVTANRAFRDVADVLGSVAYQHVIPQIVRDPQGFAPDRTRDDAFGRGFIRRMAQMDPRSREARLTRMREALRTLVPHLGDLRLEVDEAGGPRLRAQMKGGHGDTRTHETAFSDGTLRLIGMLWALFEGDGPLLLEEPELSLHTEVVRQLPQVFAQMQMEIGTMRRREEDPFARQLIVTTHADEMLRDASIGAHEVVLVRPGTEDYGATLEVADEGDRETLRTTRLTPADVLLPKTRTTPSIAPRL